jgi:GMP synthase (glutamine-hydrolysing)
MTPHLLVIQPDALGPLDKFAEWLGDDLILRVVRPYEDETVPTRLAEDGLIVLGGAMSSLDDTEFPWLANIRALVVDAIAGGRPALGICLGGQLMAQALGGSVAKGDQGLEAGVVDIEVTASAGDDPLLSALPPKFPAGAWHGDMIEKLPTQAVWLARSSLYPHQAFRVGSCAWAVQFHPELSRMGYNSWAAAIRSDDHRDLTRIEQGQVEFAKRELDVFASMSMLARTFAGVVHGAEREPGDVRCITS